MFLKAAGARLKISSRKSGLSLLTGWKKAEDLQPKNLRRPEHEICQGGFHLSEIPLDYPLVKAGETISGSCENTFILTTDWLGWLCYLFVKLELVRIKL